MFSPTGSVVRTMRVTAVTVAPDGTVKRMSNAGAGVIVRVRPDSASRRNFAKYLRRHGLQAYVAEQAAGAEGTYNRRTGAETGRENLPADEYADPRVTAWQVMGDGPALVGLTGMDPDADTILRSEPKPFVADWSFAVNVRPPMSAQGSGPEKVRPPMGSAFGKRSQVEATAAALHTARQQRVAAEHRAEEQAKQAAE